MEQYPFDLDNIAVRFFVVVVALPLKEYEYIERYNGRKKKSYKCQKNEIKRNEMKGNITNTNTPTYTSKHTCKSE